MPDRTKKRRNEIAIRLLAANIRKYRQAQNLTIEKLAALLEIDYAQLSRVERGLTNPTISFIYDVAASLKIAPAQLLEE